MRSSKIELEQLTIEIFGLSHSPEIGVVIQGMPAGESIDQEKLQAFLERRAPGRSAEATARKEPDKAEFIEGLTNQQTDGTVLKAIIKNTNTRSHDYDNVIDIPRPGHADYPAFVKYKGQQETAGGGHFSGRLTAPLCIAGGICLQALQREGIEIGAHIYAIQNIYDTPFDPLAPSFALHDQFPVLNADAGEQMKQRIHEAKKDGDSVGGIIECAAMGLPVGLGEHMFYGIENTISRLAFAVPAVKGIEFGEGFGAAMLYGSENNDPYYMNQNKIQTKTNHHGGVLGGMTSGMPLLFRTAIKPTPSIAKEQDSISLSKRENTKLVIRGRHDPCIVPRAVPVMEAVCAIALYDALLTEKEKENGTH
ncbi:MAG: chorismate synthase [Clostridiales bacterium]|nr:chorismate synthase [Clostridiales bacterium]